MNTSNKQMFVPRKPFYFGLIFAIKARAYPSEAPDIT